MRSGCSRDFRRVAPCHLHPTHARGDRPRPRPPAVVPLDDRGHHRRDRAGGGGRAERGLIVEMGRADARGYLLPSAVLVLAAALVVARRLFAFGDPNGSGVERLWSLTVGVLVLGAVLWLTALYAAEKGERAAVDRANTLTSADSIDLIPYSENLLALEKDRIHSSRSPPRAAVTGSSTRGCGCCFAPLTSTWSCRRNGRRVAITSPSSPSTTRPASTSSRTDR